MFSGNGISWSSLLYSEGYVLVREKCIGLKIVLTVFQVNFVHGYLFWNAVAFEGRHMAPTELGVIFLGT